VYSAFERRNVMLEVIALARKLTLRPRHRRVATLDECAHSALHVLRFRRADNRPWHSEQRCVASRDAFFVGDADL
jgi:hypothetical protein